LAAALAELGGGATTSQLAQALSAPDLLTDVSALQAAQQELRRQLGLEGGSTVLSGHVVALGASGGVLELEGLGTALTVPRELLEQAGVNAVGEAVSATWELLPGGRTLMTVEPAVEAASVNALGEPLVDLYGTPWGRALTGVDEEVLAVAGAPTVHIPAGIPDVA
jgi:hypothetical protein